MADIIVFPARSRPNGVRCEDAGVTFPTIYRVNGFYFAASWVKGARFLDPIARGEQAPPHYTLSDNDNCGLKDCRWDAIDRLDASKDAVSLVARYHLNRDRAYGYIDAKIDVEREEGPARGLFDTPQGLFTLMAIETAAWWPGPLIVYGADVPAPPGSIVDTVCWTWIVAPNGEVLDENILSPPEMN